jgi:hypothetical protein
MNANKPHHGQVGGKRAAAGTEDRRNVSTHTDPVRRQASHNERVARRRQVGALRDAKAASSEVQTRRGSRSLLAPVSAPTVSHKTAPSLFSVETMLVYVGYVTATLLVVLFLSDLIAKMPFYRASLLMDVSFICCGLLLGYLSWNAHRDLI